MAEPLTRSLRAARALSGALLARAEHARLRKLDFRDAGHGYDTLGLHPDAVALAAGMCRPFYEKYFRVESRGSHQIPARGAVILAANHSGMLPIDALMICCDVLRHTSPPRMPRPIGDIFIPSLPIVGTLLARAGMVGGSPGNFRHLLESGEIALVFPEGVHGIGKGFTKRYELQEWHWGHAELAIRHRVPIVPVAVIGAEESWPQIARLRLPRLFGAPWLPIPATPVPLPAKYHIYYGEPLELFESHTLDDADDPERLEHAALSVKSAVKRLIERGLQDRAGVFI